MVGLGLVTAETFLEPTQQITINSDGSWWAYTYQFTSTPSSNWESGSFEGTIDIPIIYGDYIGFWTYDDTSAQYTQSAYYFYETLYTSPETSF